MNSILRRAVVAFFLVYSFIFVSIKVIIKANNKKRILIVLSILFYLQNNFAGYNCKLKLVNLI